MAFKALHKLNLHFSRTFSFALPVIITLLASIVSSRDNKLIPISPQIEHVLPPDFYFPPFNPTCNFYLLLIDCPRYHVSKPDQAYSLLKSICRALKSGSMISSSPYSRTYYSISHKTVHELHDGSLTQIMLLGLRDHILFIHLHLPPSRYLADHHPHSRDSANSV